jgi:hypothetical protein
LNKVFLDYECRLASAVANVLIIVVFVYGTNFKSMWEQLGRVSGEKVPGFLIWFLENTSIWYF